MWSAAILRRFCFLKAGDHDTARAQEAWADAGLPGTGPVSVDQLEQARAAARKAG